MKPPAWWARDGLRPRLLAPIGAVVAAAAARRIAAPGWRAPVPVLCCGNAVVGGAGKTTLALDLAARLTARGVAVHLLTRGYGGQARGPLRVDPMRHAAALVGDEPLLLAAAAPTWVCADRAAGARAALASGAAALLMDDGLQNPSLAKTASLLVIDGAAGFGNGRMLPSGPLREPVHVAARRCVAAVLIGEDRTGALAALPADTPVLLASLAANTALHGRRVLAFAGIARPAKFHETLRAAGAEVADAIDFPDHHRFTAAELDAVLARAAALGAEPVTTPKDAVRLSADMQPRVGVVGVRLVWEDEPALDCLLKEIVA